MLKTSAQGKGKCYNLEVFYLHILKRVRISISDWIFPQMERLPRVRKHLGTRRKSRLSGSDSAIRRTKNERWGKFTAISIIPPYGIAVEGHFCVPYYSPSTMFFTRIRWNARSSYLAVMVLVDSANVAVSVMKEFTFLCCCSAAMS